MTIRDNRPMDPGPGAIAALEIVRANMGDAAAIQVCRAHAAAYDARVQPPPWMTKEERKRASTLLEAVAWYRGLEKRIEAGKPLTSGEAPKVSATALTAPALRPVRFDVTVPPGWEWDEGDPLTGRARHGTGAQVVRRRYNRWEAQRGGKMWSGGHSTPMAAAMDAMGEA
jgi:hypothetical protein